MTIRKTETLIIGAGVSGLSLAHRLHKAQHSFLLIDQRNRLGGVVETEEKEGFLFEKGPNSAILSNSSVIRLIDDLQDKCEIEIGPEIVKKRYVLKNNRWEALPNSLKTAIKTPLFTFKDKLRILGEPFRKKGNDPEESLAHLVKRRMGQSFLDYAIDPFIIGVYAGDPAFLVPKYALPKLYNLEQQYGSFVKGAIQKKKEPKTDLEKRADKSIYSFKGGFRNFIKALSISSGGEQNQILSAQNLSVERLDNGRYLATYNCGGKEYSIDCKRIVSTVGAYALGNLFPFIPKKDLDSITNLNHAQVFELAIGFKEWKGRPLDGFGALIPHKEQKKILGIMFMSSVFSGRAPKGGALFSIFMGGVRQKELMQCSKEEIFKILEKEFSELMDLDEFKPDLLEIGKHSRAIPQYGKESKQRFEAVEAIENQYKNLIVAGNLRNGIGMADRIEQAYRIADSILKTEEDR